MVFSHLKVLWRKLFLMIMNSKFKKKLIGRITDEIIQGQRTAENQRPNLTVINQRILFSSDTLRSNIKALGDEYARSLQKSLKIPDNLSLTTVGLVSKACQQQDIESEWLAYWSQQMGITVAYQRKLWEHCYILQVMYEYNLLKPRLKGIGFGCGEEPLPSLLVSYDIEITVTDLNPEESSAKGWIDTNQNASSKEKIWRSKLCMQELFEKNVSLRYVDMNNIPTDLDGKYDFCWSSCALEHLGSIENGLHFIENSLNTLLAGGVSIHTTEFNYLEEEETIDNWRTVLFRKKDFTKLFQKLTAQGHQVAPLDFDIGTGFLDKFIDIPPYTEELHAHLKLLLDGFTTTSFGIVIRKSSCPNLKPNLLVH
ncbi:MAG: hypothetical protein DCF19_09560 [Pseudanabaena frigida]|uniref:Uncharacterized protein n=1 Tax=Pseudanabaena frigida TaxID=945775 RepID=A0A2W4WAD6_9CYAN|nr:MAG: hypothetical protein DCF19_09560 [Pseudanabaena frigida]